MGTKPKNLTLFPELEKVASNTVARDQSLQSIKNKMENDKKSEIGRVEKRQEIATKAKIFKLEQGNRERLYVYHATGEWWKLGGNSALIYVYILAKRIFRDEYKPKLNQDTDFNNKFEFGTASTKDIKKFTQRLENINLKIEEQNKNYIVFLLPQPITENEINRLKKVVRGEQEQINTIVMQKNVFPGVYHRLIQMQREIYHGVLRMPNFQKEIYGTEMLKVMKKTVLLYIRMTNGHVEKVTALKGIADSMIVVSFEIQEATEMELIDKRRAKRILDMLVEVKRLAEKELKNADKDVKETVGTMVI